MERIKAGKIVNTHGIRGDVKIDVWMNDARDLCAIEKLYIGDARYEIIRARAQKNLAIAHLSGVDTVEAAEALKGKEISVERADVPMEDGEYFIADIIGLRVTDAQTGKFYGTITEVYTGIANDAYEIVLENGKQVLFPSIPDVVKSVDIAAGEMKITPLNGMFEI